MKSFSDFLLTVLVAAMASLATTTVLDIVKGKPAPAAACPQSGCRCDKSPTTPPGHNVGELGK